MAEFRRRRLLRRMDALDARATASARRARIGPHRRAATAVGLLVVLVGGLSFSARLSDDVSVFPERPSDAQDDRINEAVDVSEDSDAFKYARKQKGGDEPVTYDPCAPIHVTVQSRTIIDGGMRMLQESLGEIGEATGLTFVVDGLVDAVPDPDVLRTKDDESWRPVNVSWSDPERDSRLKGDVAGFAGSASVERDGRRWYVTGNVVLDGPQLAEIVDREDGWAAARSVVVHELGHLVGLDHVDAPGQLMRAKGSAGITDLGAGDRAGLAGLGRGPCIDY